MVRDDFNKECDALWKEKTELENLKVSEEEFVPAQVVEHDPNEKILIKIIL